MTTVILHSAPSHNIEDSVALLTKHFGCKDARVYWKLGDPICEDWLHITSESAARVAGKVAEINADCDIIDPIFRPEVRSYHASVWDALEDELVTTLLDDQPPMPEGSKPTNPSPDNPKDAVGVRKWRQFAALPLTVLAEVGVGMLEGARKYGRHNYRVAGVRSSIYVDAAIGHIMQYWEGEDTDPDSGLSHVTKAICSLVVLRDAMIQNMLTDDRPPKANLDQLRADLQRRVDEIFERHPNPKPAFIEGDQH